MVMASVTGAIDYTAYESSRQWWTGTRFKLDMLERTLMRETVACSSPKSTEAFNLYRSMTLPWFSESDLQNNEEQKIDAVATWYAVFGKDVSNA